MVQHSVTPTWVPTLRLSLGSAAWARVVEACGGAALILETPQDLFPFAPLDPLERNAPYFQFQYEGFFYAACRDFNLDLRPGSLYLGLVAQPPLVRAHLAGPGPITYLALPDLSEARLTPLVDALNAIVAPALMPLTPTTLALWNLGDTNPALAGDQTGRFNMTGSSGVLETTAPLVNGTGLARTFPSSSTSLFTATEHNPPATTALLGEWTVEAWVMLAAPPPIDVFFGYATIAVFGINGNELLHLRVRNDLVMETVWNYGSVPSVVVAIDTTVLALNTRYHLAARKRSFGGVLFVDFFVNGALSSTAANLHNADGGVDDDWGLGGNFTGVLQNVRVSSVALEDGQILADYQMGA